MTGGAECFVDGDFGLISLPVTIPVFLAFFLFFMQMGQSGPHEHFSTTCLGITIAQGIAAVQGGTSAFTVGAGVRGMCQSFLVSNKFSVAGTELGQGVSCLTGALGMSSSGGGLEL